jgi:hypothetical protein
MTTDRVKAMQQQFEDWADQIDPKRLNKSEAARKIMGVAVALKNLAADLEAR